MDKLLFIIGPTATGKTATALALSKKFLGELISADSRQVYREMDIGTGKDLPHSSVFHEVNKDFIVRDLHVSYGYYNVQGTAVWLLDAITPDKRWSVAHFQNLAHKTITKILDKNHLPIIVGGTGLYVRSLTSTIETINISPNNLLREKLNAFPVEKLQEYLKKINITRFQKMNNSDRNNPVRLIRAIEITQSLEKQVIRSYPLYDILKIGLTVKKEELQRKINKRVEQRMKDGMLEEIKCLLKDGYSWDSPGMSGLGYRQWKGYFESKETQCETIEAWKREEYRYAKRQMTWFKRDPDIVWFDGWDPNFYSKIEEKVEKWYTSRKVK